MDWEWVKWTAATTVMVGVIVATIWRDRRGA
jgi:hypothetical protein